MDDSQKLLAALGYPIWIIALVMAIVEKKDKDVKFHAWNALFFGLAMFAVYIVVWIVIVILGFIPVVGWAIAALLSIVMMLLGLGWLVLAIIYAIKAYNGKPVSIPFVTNFAKKYAK